MPEIISNAGKSVRKSCAESEEFLVGFCGMFRVCEIFVKIAESGVILYKSKSITSNFCACSDKKSKKNMKICLKKHRQNLIKLKGGIIADSAILLA